ncbi:DUF4113 domain-containing protein [Vogesella indigofera]
MLPPTEHVVWLAPCGWPEPVWKMPHDRKSPNYTTRWSELATAWLT